MGINDELLRAMHEIERLTKERDSALRVRDAAVEASDFFAEKMLDAEAAWDEARAALYEIRRLLSYGAQQIVGEAVAEANINAAWHTAHKALGENWSSPPKEPGT